MLFPALTFGQIHASRDLEVFFKENDLLKPAAHCYQVRVVLANLVDGLLTLGRVCPLFHVHFEHLVDRVVQVRAQLLLDQPFLLRVSFIWRLDLGLRALWVQSPVDVAVWPVRVLDCLLVADEGVTKLVLLEVLRAVRHIMLQGHLIQLLDLPDFDVARRLRLLLILLVVLEVVAVLVFIVELDALEVRFQLP